MKNLNFIILVSAFLITTSCQKDVTENQEDEADFFVGIYYSGDKLEIQKVDKSSVKLIFTHSGGWTQWNHTFFATVAGNSLTIPEWQYWESEGLNCKGNGFLVDNVLTINYYYSNGSKELGVTYDKVK